MIAASSLAFNTMSAGPMIAGNPQGADGLAGWTATRMVPAGKASGPMICLYRKPGSAHAPLTETSTGRSAAAPTAPPGMPCTTTTRAG
jgi:hypothetical protein